MTAPGQCITGQHAAGRRRTSWPGLVLLLVAAVAVALVWIQFRGGFATPRELTLISSRSGLSMDPGSKVTYNGVEIGRVARHRRSQRRR